MPPPSRTPADAWPTRDPAKEDGEAPGVARVVCNGLPAVQVSTGVASALVYCHGAHLAAYRPHGTGELLWMSTSAQYDGRKALRGGVPVCAPWFGPAEDPALPQHGFARTRAWRYLGSASWDGERGAAVELRFELSTDDETLALYPHPLRAQLRLVVGERLHMALTTTNVGDAPLVYGSALHTYLAVADIARCSIEGLESTEYLDKTRGNERFAEARELVRIAEETDRVYFTDRAAVVHDEAGGRSITVSKGGSAQTVVWNPWRDKARSMGDFDDAGYLQMVCVEAANTGECSVVLAPGQSYTLEQGLSVSPT